MTKIVTIKLKTAGPRIGPFLIKDEFNNILAENVSRETLKHGISYEIIDDTNVITICSTGKIKVCKNFSIGEFDVYEYASTKFNNTGNSCVWTHLKDPTIYNTYYNNVEPYILEYPFTYQVADEILRNVQDYTKVYKYIPTTDTVLVDYSKYELDDVWFNKAILYNGQQNSGVLNLVTRVKNNLKDYLSYPVFRESSKDIIFSKSDNIYQYNSFWNIVSEPYAQQFIKDCESLSIDKQINQSVMDYSSRIRRKEPLRAKELKVRHILDNRGDIKLVSQFIITPIQTSY